MKRQEVYEEIKGLFGVVPDFLKKLPDSSIEQDWKSFQASYLGETAVSNKTRELIGIGVSAATGCKHCIYYHTRLAKLHGATDEEIEAAVHIAMATSGWGTYVKGMQMDYEEFKAQIDKAAQYVEESQSAMV